ncbi:MULTISPECIES: hypothetical protein [Elizabethkingia]|uniref:hypothetical protein n=1 Tax=Elizabethkingia TaxID=308865 RepID=UPI0007517C27|nr:hypothetical protein [Elizabethkingia ursingii]KUY29537.1 hypothetical protein ATB96_02400 [Elizabethkingia ursingii]
MKNTILRTLESNTLQLHYYLEKDSHSMDAIVLNKAEGELLKILNEISHILNVDLTIETQALEEGGVKAIYKFLTKKDYKKNTKLILGFIATISATVIANVISDKITKDPEMEKLQKQEMRLNIMKLKKELNEAEEKEKGHENDTLKKLSSSENISIISDYISESNKIKVFKSNFYSTAKNERKLTKISTQILDENKLPISKEKFVLKKEFADLILENTDLEDDYQQNIAIEIVAPVLKGNSLKWKGIYKGENVTFSLKDKNFRNLIEDKNLKFTNGTKIICDIETKRKMNKDGEIIYGTKSVYDVVAIHYPDGNKIDIM